MLAIISIICDIVILIGFIYFSVKYQKRRVVENKCYTDYVHKNLILRVYKHEFEYEAVGKLQVDKILDRGTLTQFYDWCLFEA